MDDGPGYTKPISKLTEASRVECLRHRHVNLAAVGKNPVYPFCFFRRIDGEVHVHAVNLLEDGGRNIVSNEYRVTDVHPCMNDRIAGSGRRAWCLALIHHHRNLPAKMLLVETKCLFAIPGEVQLRMQLHECSFGRKVSREAGSGSRARLY